jgi:ferritin
MDNFTEEFCAWFVRQNQEEYDAIKHVLRQAKCLGNWGVLLDSQTGKTQVLPEARFHEIL